MRNQNPLEILVVDDIFGEGLYQEDKYKEDMIRDYFNGKKLDIGLNPDAEYLKEECKNLGVNLTIVPTYNYPESTNFESVIDNNYNFCIVDGTFPIFPDRENVNYVKTMIELFKNAENSNTEESIRDNFSRFDIDSGDFRKQGCLYESVLELLQKIEDGYLDTIISEDIEDIDSYAGVLTLKELSDRDMNYLLFTNDPSHGRFSIYSGIANDLLSIDNLVKNCKTYTQDTSFGRQVTPEELIQKQEICNGAVVFGEGHGEPGYLKGETYPYLIEKVVEHLRSK